MSAWTTFRRPRPCNRRRRSRRYPAGAAESVVLIATEFDQNIVAAITGLVFARDESQAYIVVDSDPYTRLRVEESQLEYRAVIGQGPSARRVLLKKAAVLESGKRTVFSGPVGELPPPLPSKTAVAARERSPLLLIGVEARRGEGGTEYSIVAVPGEVEGLYRNPVTLDTSYGFRPIRPTLVRRGVLVTPEGVVVATAAIDPAQPRMTSGYVRYLGPPLSELTSIGRPEVADARGNIRVFDGKATVDVVLRPLDPLSRLKRARLLVRTSFAPQQEERPGATDSMQTLRNEQVPIRIEQGRWMDKPADGQEIDLAVLESVAPSLDIWLNKDQLPVGKAWGGRCQFTLQRQGPFAWTFVSVGDDGYLTPLEMGGGLLIHDNLETYSVLLRPPTYGRSEYPTQAKRPNLTKHADGGVILCADIARNDVMVKAVEFQPSGKTQFVKRSLLGAVRVGPSAAATAALDLSVFHDGHYRPYDLRAPMCLTADGRTLFVVDGANVLHKIDVATWTDVMQLPLEGNCEEAVLSSAGLVLPLPDKNAILIVDVETFVVKHVLPCDTLRTVAACEKSPYVYVIESQRWVIFDAALGRAVQYVPGAISGMAGLPRSMRRQISAALTSDGRYLFVGAERVARVRVEGLQMVLEEVSPELGTDNTARVTLSADAGLVALPTNTGKPRGSIGFELRNGFNMVADPVYFDNGERTLAVGIATETGLVFSHGRAGTAAIFDLKGKLVVTAELGEDRNVRRILVLPPGDRAVYWSGVLMIVDTNAERLKASKK